MQQQCQWCWWLWQYLHSQCAYFYSQREREKERDRDVGSWLYAFVKCWHTIQKLLHSFLPSTLSLLLSSLLLYYFLLMWPQRFEQSNGANRNAAWNDCTTVSPPLSLFLCLSLWAHVNNKHKFLLKFTHTTYIFSDLFHYRYVNKLQTEPLI